MAGIEWNWTKALLGFALVVTGAAGQVAAAQAVNNGGAIAGKLTDVRSVPLAGATVVVRNEATGTESRTTTAQNGNFRFTGLAPGEYTLEAQCEKLGHGRLGGIFVAAGHEARVQAAMEFEPVAPGSIQTASIPAILAPTNPAIRTAPTPALQIASRPVILTASDPAIQAIFFPPIQAENLALVDTPAPLPVRAALHPMTALTPLVTTSIAVEPLLAIPIAGQTLPSRPDLIFQWRRPCESFAGDCGAGRASVLALEMKGPHGERKAV